MNFKNDVIKISALIVIISLFVRCDKFLEMKPDKALTVPETVKDIRGLLDYQYRINDNFPGLADLACDDYFVDYTTWKSRDVTAQGLYVWESSTDVFDNSSWSAPYMTIMVANVAL